MDGNSSPIESNFIYEGVEYNIVYQDADSFDHLDSTLVKQVYALCTLTGRNSFLVVHDHEKDSWGFPGGGKEIGETIEEGMRRELREETGGLEAKVIKPIGYQTIKDQTGKVLEIQVRYFCIIDIDDLHRYEIRKVEDPAGDVDMICAVPSRWTSYFPEWGDIGKRIIARAHRFNQELNR